MPFEPHEVHLSTSQSYPNNKKSNINNINQNIKHTYEQQEPVYYSYQNALKANHNMYEYMMSSNAENLYLQDSVNQVNDMNVFGNQYFPYTQNYQPYPSMQQYMSYVPYYSYQQEPVYQNDMGYYTGYNYMQQNSNVIDNTIRRVDKNGNDISPLSATFINDLKENKDVMIRIPVMETKLDKGLRLSDEDRNDLIVFLKEKRIKDKCEVYYVNVEGEGNKNLPLKSRKPKRDGVWTDTLKEAIELCVCTIPKDESNKMRLNMKQYGRNELISMYIKVQLGEYRKVKQVSSHIQVWKNRLRKEIIFLSKIMKWKKNDSKEETYNKKETMNFDMFLKKYDLKDDQEIEHFNKMMKLIYNLLEYGMYRDTDAMIRFEELFSKVSKQLKAGVLKV
ncbi:hypothetical protein ACO0R3_001719 [Hanseniaspora guilliermondii]